LSPYRDIGDDYVTKTFDLTPTSRTSTLKLLE